MRTACTAGRLHSNARFLVIDRTARCLCKRLQAGARGRGTTRSRVAEVAIQVSGFRGPPSGRSWSWHPHARNGRSGRDAEDLSTVRPKTRVVLNSDTPRTRTAAMTGRRTHTLPEDVRYTSGACAPTIRTSCAGTSETTAGSDRQPFPASRAYDMTTASCARSRALPPCAVEFATTSVKTICRQMCARATRQLCINAGAHMTSPGASGVPHGAAQAEGE
jgi:hypothetical protein